jgi:TolB protein
MLCFYSLPSLFPLRALRVSVVNFFLACCLLSDNAVFAEPPTRLTHDGHFKERPQWSADGARLLFTRHRGSTITQCVWLAASQQDQKLSARTDPEFDGTWSPDGKQIAFTFDKTSPNQGNQEVYVCDADGGQPRLVSGDRGALSHEEWPSWSPDGRQLTYVSTRYGNAELCVIAVSGGDERRLTNDPALDGHPAWSPDGKQIAFATNRWGDWELALVDVASGDVRRLTTSPGLDDYPAWSPDGRRLAFTSNRDGNLEIYQLDLASGQATNLSQHPAIDNFPTFRADGALTWVSNRQRGFDIYVQVTPPR